MKWKFYANLAKKLVCFFAWAIEKEAEQIPFASFRFKANFFLLNRQPIVLGPDPHEESIRGGWKTVYVIFYYISISLLYSRKVWGGWSMRMRIRILFSFLHGVMPPSVAIILFPPLIRGYDVTLLTGVSFFTPALYHTKPEIARPSASPPSQPAPFMFFNFNISWDSPFNIVKNFSRACRPCCQET